MTLMKRLTLAVGGIGFFLAGAMAEASSINLPVPRTTIHPGEEITHQHLIERRFPSRTAQQFRVVPHRNDAVGKTARRTLPAGRPIPENAVENEVLVKRGEPARLVFQEQGLIIIMQVEAMQSGSEGKVVRVRNIDSGLIVTGVVQDDGTIRAEN